MKKITKTIEILDRFEDEFHTLSWEYGISGPFERPSGSVSVRSSITGQEGSIPVSKEFLEELQKREYAKFKVEIKFLDDSK